MLILGVIVLGICLWLMGQKQKQGSSSTKEKGKALDWLLTGGLAVFLLLVFRVGWVQAFLRLQYWVWALLPFLRRDDDTRFERSTDRPAGGSPSSQMTRAEAALILGIEETASEIEIQKAYKQLMLKLHPDAGGNGYLAGKLNEARDCLLRSG